MKQIPLRNKAGEVVDWSLVDDEDFNYINQFIWRLVITNENRLPVKYAHRSIGNKSIRMHRLIMSRYSDINPFVIDHKDSNGLNNQKSNLRICSQSDNLKNQRKQSYKKTTSKYKGVYFDEFSGKWDARVGSNREGNRVYIKKFANETDAGIAYDLIAREKFGEFANLNFDSISKEDEERVRKIMRNHKISGTSSSFIGIHKHKDKFAASCKHNGKTIYIGIFLSEIEAAVARDKMVIELGINTYLNFPNE